MTGVNDQGGPTLDPGNRAETGPPDVSLLEGLTFLLRHRKVIGTSMLVPFVLVVIARSFVAPLYTSSASFMPQAADQLSSLAGLAAQFGVGVPGKGREDSPSFYSDLLGSREVLQTILEATYEFQTDTGVARATLFSTLDMSGSTPALQMERAIKHLGRHLESGVNPRTGVVTFSVSLTNADLARKVAQRLLDEVNRFNLERRKSQAGEEMAFNARRLDELRTELREAEGRLEEFLERNRDFRNSPQLSFQKDRLLRDVEFRQTIYTTVAQAYEKARMDEVRDTPVITVLEQPNLPARSEGRGRVIFGLAALMGGGLLGVAIASWREYLQRRRQTGDPQYRAFELAAEETKEELQRRWGRRLRRSAPRQ